MVECGSLQPNLGQSRTCRLTLSGVDGNEGTVQFNGTIISLRNPEQALPRLL